MSDSNVSKKQRHHFQYTVIVKNYITGEYEQEVFTARLLQDALHLYCKDCIDKGKVGIFHPLNEIDVSKWSQDRRFRIINVQGQEFGIIPEDVIFYAPTRNKYINQMRAKRELLGFNSEEFAYECGLNESHFRQKEEGSRSMKLEEYACCMKVLELYEEMARNVNK